ncbi:TIGR00288 family NYN domain-containing protein [Candidatus Micrarchaeota archaeon]|nr:TIGR00288 family NYN domain-containing protein [Candidatus Micrarchaeota archaeon]
MKTIYFFRSDVMGIFEKIFGKGKPQIALFVDGPNVIRKQLSVDLREVKRKVSEYGNIRFAKIYLDQYASDKLIEAMVNQGFVPQITTGDVDVTLAVEATEQIVSPKVDIVAIMSRDTDFIPVLNKIKEHGKESMVVGVEPGFSVALKNTADYLIMVKAKERSMGGRAKKKG